MICNCTLMDNHLRSGTMQLNDLIRKLDTIAMLDTTLTYLLTPDFGLKRGVNFQTFGTLADVVHHYREKYAKKNLDVWDTVLKELYTLWWFQHV